MTKTRFHRISLLSLFAMILLIIGFTFAGGAEQIKPENYNEYFDIIETTHGSYSTINYGKNNTGFIIRSKKTNQGNFLLKINEAKEEIRCFEQLNGFYINPKWEIGEIGIVPLSESTLTLGKKAGKFSNLTMNGGFYTTCISENGKNVINPDAVFGHIGYSTEEGSITPTENDGNEKTEIIIDNSDESQYQIQAGIDFSDEKEHFNDELLILIGGDEDENIDISAQGFITDSHQPNQGEIHSGEGTYKGTRTRYRGSTDVRNLEFLEPARSGGGDPSTNIAPTWYTTGRIIEVKIYGITGYSRELSGDIEQSKAGTFESNSTRVGITLTNQLGEKTIEYHGYSTSSRDDQRVHESNYTITLNDGEPPHIGIIQINNDDPFTNDENVRLILEADDAGVGMTNGTMRFSCDGDSWSNREQYDTIKDWNLNNGNGCTNGDGEKTVYVQFKDAANNGPIERNDTIILDTTKPTCNITGNPTDWTNGSPHLTLYFGTETNPLTTGYSRDGITYSSSQTKIIQSNGIYTGYVKDQAGNIGSCSVEVTKIDTTKPVCTVRTQPTKSPISANNGYNTGKVIFECIDTGSHIKTMNLTSGAILFSHSNVVTLSNNAITGYMLNGITYEFTYTVKTDGNTTFKIAQGKVKDNANNVNAVSQESNAVVVRTHLDNCPVTYNPAQSASRTNQDVTATLNCPEGITITNNGGLNYMIFTESGTGIFTYRDDLYNINSTEVEVSWIDKTVPDCGTWTYSPSQAGGPTNQSVIATANRNDSQSGPESSGTSCTIQENNNSCSVIITDNAGNSRQCVSNIVTWIDKTKPILNNITEIGTTDNTTPNYTFNSTEAGTITYGGACHSTTTNAIIGNNEITFNALGSGTYSNCTIMVTDAAGNNSDVLQVPTFTIQTNTPVCTVQYTPETRTTGNVVAELSCPEGVTITNNGGNNTYEFTGNDTFIFEYENNTNNTGSTTAQVTRIDRTAPVLGEVTIIPPYTNDTTPTYTFSSTEAGTITYGGDCSSTIENASSGNNNITFNTLSAGTYSNCTIMVTDAAGNDSNILDIRTFTIQTDAPTCTITYNPAAGTLTNQDVTATLNCPEGVTATSVGGFNHTFNANGHFTFTYKDASNNQGSAEAQVTWIDKIAPTLTGITEIGTTENRTPDYTFESSEAGTISYNGSCNADTTQAVVGENTITFNELEIGYHSDCSIIVTDAAGNNGTLNITPFTISGHNAPTTTLIGWGAHTVPSMWKQDITVDIIRYEGAAGGVIISDTNDINSVSRHLGYTPITTGRYTTQINNEDKNGKYVCAFGTTGGIRETICSEYPIKIDISNPSLQLTNPINGSNFNSGDTIVLQWNGHDEPSGISGYTLIITDPDNNTETYYYDSGTTSKTYTINKSGTWQRSVAANDIVGHTGYETRTFTVPYSGGNNESGGESLSGFNLISPALGDQINLGENVILSWLSGTINSGYIREVKNISGTIIASGYTTLLTVTVDSELFTTGAYSWSVKDIASETTKSIALFYIVDSQNIPDLKISQFEFDEIKDAKLDEYYQSNTITIKGLSNNWYSYAYLKDGIGALYINDRFVGTNGFVKNGDEIYIEMKASDQYNKTVKANLIVGGGINAVSGDFKITTKNGINGRDDSSLTPMQKLWGIIFVDSLVEMYQYDEEKLATFLSTFMQLLQDKSDYYAREIQEAENDGDENLAKENKLYKDAIDFLYVTVKYRYDNIEVEDRTVYIAPNGKQYLVEYDENRMAYTSPDFARPKYFPTRELFTNHININNPAVGKWGIVGNVVTAHNGKVYTIYETNGKWTSSNFKTAKYFDTKEDIINHILANNPASSWNHTVDPDFEQVTYTAPNGKVYKIFRTSSKGNNPDMYSSYNFVNAKYFTSLEAAKKFIDQNNKK